MQDDAGFLKTHIYMGSRGQPLLNLCCQFFFKKGTVLNLIINQWIPYCCCTVPGIL